MKKLCKKCNENKPIEEFHLKNSEVGTRCHKCRKCRKCQKKYSAKWYQHNKQKHIDRVRRQQQNLAKTIRDIKSQTPCKDCQRNYPYYVMDFDHLNGETKEFGIASNLYRGSTNKISNEIKKCEIVCANCHRIRTHARKHGTEAIVVNASS